jgi:cytochrome bd-type quinol oxidase subunit 2
VLDGYTLLEGVLALAALVLHGANYLADKAEGPVNRRARAPSLLASFTARPWGVVFPILAVGGLTAVWRMQAQQHDFRSLLASGVYLVGMLTRSTRSSCRPLAHSLTVANASAPTLPCAWLRRLTISTRRRPRVDAGIYTLEVPDVAEPNDLSSSTSHR